MSQKIITIRIIGNYVLALSLLILVSCSGGSDSGGGDGSQTTPAPVTPTTPTTPSPTPIPSGTVFSLAKIFSPSPLGLIYSTLLKGGDLLGITLTGSLTRTNQAQILLGGIMVTPSEVAITIKSIFGDQIDIFTEYYDISGNFISSKETNGTVCTPAVVEIPPLMVKVGDTGAIPDLTCSDGTTLFATWRVENAGDGTVLFITTGGEKDMNGVQVISNENTFKINTAGDIVSLKLVTKDTAGVNTTTIESI